MLDHPSWLFWAVLSAVFAALTAIFAKIGLREVDPNLATLLRTVIILIFLALIVWYTGRWRNPFEFPGQAWLFLS
ncbi:MAG: EamA family transporter, partial [Pirellulaceae bacterium]